MIQILEYGQVPNDQLFQREMTPSFVESAVSRIIENVKQRGDDALREYSLTFDKVQLGALEVSRQDIEEALALTDPDFIRILKLAADNIRHFHEKQLKNSFIINDQPGVVMGQKVLPIENVGLYVPGGRAAYPSTVLMDSIPAKIAGCRQLIMVTPPQRNGKVDPAILAAASIAGVDRVFRIGGAQAIAALAYGTESVPKVDKIVGPGNAYVAEAKKQVFGYVAIDMIAGPSEVLVVSDGGSDPAHVAADMLAQAEHDPMATAVLVTDSMALAKAVAGRIEEQLKTLERETIARASIEDRGKIIVVEDLSKAIDIANEIAPEHLELSVENPFDYLDSIRHAGSIFLGRNTPEALGDYMAGPNHTLPTLGTARFSSPLSVDDFVKKTQYTYFTKDALGNLYRDVAVFARKEGLTAHARSAEIRFEARP